MQAARGTILFCFLTLKFITRDSIIERMSLKRSFNSQSSRSTPLQAKSKHIVPSKQQSKFVEGSIVRIKLRSFLTYDAVEFKTGPYLNVIIGPNGTGKSAIVCAICLGLAGKTNWLGRASEPKDFIKYGADKAEIEIELFNPYQESNYIIRREISKKTSHWSINRQNSTLKAVEELVTGLNIQVGNLCQFLPQEKVADFARMSQQELLENTEKSVGRESIYENHQKLKAARKDARVLEQDVSKLMEQLDQEKQKNARLEQDVKAYNDRKQFLSKVKILKMKRPWLEYERLKFQFERARDEKDKKSGELKEEKKRIAPIQTKHDGLKRQKEELEKGTKEMHQKIQSKAKDLEEQSNLMISKSDKIEEAKGDFESKVKEEEARNKRLSDLRDQLRALETGLAQMDASDAQLIARNLEKVNDDLRKLNIEMTTVQTKGQGLRREIGEIKTEIREKETQIRQIQDVNNRRLETLKIMHQNTYEAVVWLRANKHLFKHTIHEPMIISLNVTNPADAKLVESHISFNDLRSFVCEDPDDLDLFMKKVKNEQRLKVNAIKAPERTGKPIVSDRPISYYKKYGFERYMQSLFTCPEPVMRYLCMMYKVHNIPVGSSAIARNNERIMAECPELTTYYTPDVQYTIKRSKYSKNQSSRNTALREPRAFADSINVEREQELRNAIKEQSQVQNQKEGEYKELQTKSEDLEREINGFREQKRNLMKQKDQRKNIESQITTKKQRIEQVSRERINLPQERERLHQLLKKILLEKFKHLQRMKTISAECVDIAKRRVEKSLSVAACAREFTGLEADLRNAKQRFEGLEREVEELKDHVKDLKQQAREKLVEAKNVAEIGMNDQLEEKLRERGVWNEFTEAPSQIDELDSEIHSMQARAESMFQVDEKVVRDFQQREKQIQNLEQTLSERESRRQTHQEDISQARQKWLEPLNALINEINTNFSYFFSCLNCCGEVSLSEPENPEDYEKYGVCIKVKFRDDETLRELTAQHQSGGERSVSTVLYMMALQELTKCPFRSVDEINQGMDPKNERKVFQLVVQTVCKRSASQYFLLTPKLLPDLEYDKNMTVLCIYNGQHMMGHKQWKLKEFIKRRVELRDD